MTNELAAIEQYLRCRCGHVAIFLGQQGEELARSRARFMEFHRLHGVLSHDEAVELVRSKSQKKRRRT